MTDELVHYVVDNAIATITLDSPGNRNALSARLVTELTDHLATATSEQGVRAVVIQHTGTVFCSGGDLKEQSTEMGRLQGTKRMLGLLQTLVASPKPVIARIDGAVRAGGLGIVGACDIVIARRTASFAFTEARLGVAPAIISLTTSGRMTQRAVSRYYLTAEIFDADEAVAVGLTTAVVDDLDAAIGELAEALRACSPQALAETKALTTRQVCAALKMRADEMEQLSARLFASDEAQEGIQAFLERRLPRWAQH